MSWGNTTEANVGKLIYQAVAWANIADNAAASPLTALFVALHTADPGEAGAQNASEATYTGYARVSITRAAGAGGFTQTNNVFTNTSAVTFGICTAGSNSITHWSLGVASSGATVILNKAPVGPITAIWEFTAVASTDTIVGPIAALAVDDRVSFYPLEGASNSLPAGITEGTVYFVKTAAGSSITISTTSGGATLDITADGGGIMWKHSILAVALNITPSIAAGQMSITIN
jgi:hypothetical protein